MINEFNTWQITKQNIFIHILLILENKNRVLFSYNKIQFLLNMNINRL